MPTISDIKLWTIAEENIIGEVGETNITVVTPNFHEVEVLEVVAPAEIEVIDIGVVGLGNSGGGSGAVDSVNGQTGVVSLTQDSIPDGTTHKQYTATEKTKLAGIATGATANATDANLRDRSTHTGSQAISTVTNLQTSLDGKAASSHTHAQSDVTGLTTALSGKANTSHTHAQSDVTGLATSLAGKSDTGHTHVATDVTDFTTAVDARIQNIVGAAPSALDTLDELANALGDDANFASTVTTSLAGKQPLDQDLTDLAALTPANNDVLQRKAGAWTNRTMAQLKTDLALTKSDVGLSNVDNTADTSKPISTLQQAALDGKQPLDSDLTAIAGLSPSANDVMQYKSGAWVNRTIAQLKADLAIAQSDVSGLSTLLGLTFYFADGTTSTNPRPSVPGKVLWVGGTVQPVNMATGDIWIKA